jgi:glutamate/tyrosine decarboxylase-like PLP-dependent enzyme
MEEALPSGELLRRTAAIGADYVASAWDRPVAGPAALAAIEAELGELPDDPAPPEQIVDLLAATLDPGLVASTGPRYFGFVVGGSLPVAMAADWLVASWDQNSGLEVMSPAVAAVEETAGRWLLDLLGLPPSCSYGFVTGATMANWTALAAARHQVLQDRGWDVERRGLQSAPAVRVLAGGGRHTTIDLALRYLGIGTDAVTVVRQDDQGRMDVDELARLLPGLSGSPTIVCAQAGNVNSGAVDDIASVCDAAHGIGAWVHVDGAVGAWLAAAPGRRELLAGWDRADSWATDAHKGLNVGYDSGVVMTAHPDAHKAACAAVAPYLQTAEGGREGSYWVPESSRRARAVPVFAVLRQLGRSGVADMVEQMCRMASRFAAGLGQLDGATVLNDVVANQVLVRFLDSDDATRTVVRAIQESGVCWMGSTVWQDRLAMRISVSNWSTGEADVDRCLMAITDAVGAVSSPTTAGRTAPSAAGTPGTAGTSR